MSRRYFPNAAAAAVIAVLTIALLVWGLAGGGDAGPDGPVQIAGAEPEEPRLPSPDAIADAEDDAATPRDAAAVAASDSDLTYDTYDTYDTEAAAAAGSSPPAASGADGSDATTDGSGADAADARPRPTSAVASAPRPPPPREPASPVAGYRLRVPSLGVSAIMIDLGVDATGVMEVPLEAQAVAWYRFTSLPGEDGNILLGGHITWRGATAVFRYLEEMEAGDQVIIDTPSGESLRYVVREAWWAQPYEQSDVRRVIGSRSGEQTVTLFTCGGIWDTDAREYSHRRVVTAVRI